MDKRIYTHDVSSHEYDDIPELTKKDFQQGVWRIAGKDVSQKQGIEAFRSQLKNQLEKES